MMAQKNAVSYKEVKNVAAKSFEKSIEELSEIVEKLERGDVSLEESLTLFEKGVKLSKACQKILDEAEKKVSVLVADENGELVARDFLEGDE